MTTQVPSFFVHDDHLSERLSENFALEQTDQIEQSEQAEQTEPTTNILTIIGELRTAMREKSLEHPSFYRFLVSTSCHTGIDILGDGPDSHACFVAACHYYFGF